MIALTVFTLLSFAGLLWYLENWRRTLVWYLDDTVQFGAEDSYTDGKKRKEKGVHRWSGENETYGMIEQTFVLFGVAIIAAIFALTWPLSVPIGFIAGWAAWEKKRRLAKKKTKEQMVKEMEEKLAELKGEE